MPKGVYERTKPGYWAGKKRPDIGKKLQGKKRPDMTGKNNHFYGVHLLGETSPHYKNGEIKDKDGYILILKRNHPHNRDGYVREHRLIVEKQIGRYLHRFKVCHHINKVTNDNRPHNLMAFKNQSIHRKFEAGKRTRLTDIVFDGRGKT